MVAYESLNPSRRIEAAACLSMRWGDDAPGLYVVPVGEVAAYLTSAAERGGCVVQHLPDQDALDRFTKGAWIGIKAATTGNVAAWVRAIIEPSATR